MLLVETALENWCSNLSHAKCSLRNGVALHSKYHPSRFLLDLVNPFNPLINLYSCDGGWKGKR